jgi:hypothetical protein
MFWCEESYQTNQLLCAFIPSIKSKVGNMGIIRKSASARKYCAFNYGCSQSESGAIASFGIRVCGFLGGLVFAMLVFAGQAHSFETQMISVGDDVVQPSSFKNSDPSSIHAGPCSPFLGSASFQPSAHFDGGEDMAMDRTRRNAGKAAALGVMFGLRFALQPVRYKTSKTAARRNATQNSSLNMKTSGLQFDVWSTADKYRPNRSALSVAAYRQCQKERALKALRAQ